ncbi:MAG: glutaredoxin domain-containing protein [Pseudomonadota bacterium]
MKKLLLLTLLVFALYKYFPNSLPFLSTSGAFDKSGKPLVVVFVGPNCGAACDTVQNALKERGVSYQTIDVAGADGAPARNKYGINRFPTTLVGKQEILGDDTQRISTALAEAYGIEMILPRMERLAMANHFDAEGRAAVVMYGTTWCGYCKQQRAFFAAHGVPFENVDVEASQPGQLAYSALKGNGYPLTYVGFRRFNGYQEKEILEAIAELKKAKPQKIG